MIKEKNMLNFDSKSLSERFQSISTPMAEKIIASFHAVENQLGDLALKPAQFLGEPYLQHCEIDDQNRLLLAFQFPFAIAKTFQAWQLALSPILLANTGCTNIGWHVSQVILPAVKNVRGLAADSHDRINKIKHILAVSSGKGGVGKSSVTVNLAAALSAQGAKVGILDADIYGPSIPTMLGTQHATLTSPDGNLMRPVLAHDMVSNSIGYLLEEDNAMIWRGPMASKALIQLLEETDWPELDYLLIDLPPGTGDIQITLSQKIPLSGAIVITTPQDIALIDAEKGIKMFNEVNVPVLGIVENMSMHICQNCGHHEMIFGEGGAERLAQKYGVSLIGQLPLHITLREDLDHGIPTVIKHPDHAVSNAFYALSSQVSSRVYQFIQRNRSQAVQVNPLNTIEIKQVN